MTTDDQSKTPWDVSPSAMTHIASSPTAMDSFESRIALTAPPPANFPIVEDQPKIHAVVDIRIRSAPFDDRSRCIAQRTAAEQEPAVFAVEAT
jgi:hypothetical protein